MPPWIGHGIGFGLGGRRTPPPVLVSASPAFGSTAGDTVPHVLTGVGFTGATAVTVDGSACTYTVDSDTQITITATPAKAAGTYDLVVVGPGGASNALTYTALAADIWFRGDLGVTLNGSDLSAWAGQAGNGRNAVQATAANQPRPTSSASYNSHQVIRFSTNHHLTIAAFSRSQPYTWYFVGHTANGSNATIFSSEGTSGLRVYRNDFASGIPPTAQVFNGAGAATSFDATGKVFTAPCVGCVVANGASSRFHINQYSTGATGTLTGDQAGQIVIGNHLTSPLTWNWGAGTNYGWIAEIMAFSGAHDQATRQMIMAYLGTRYGITVSA